MDVEAEAQKSKTCEFWPDKEEFLKNFDLSNVDDQTADKTRELLLKFQHVFFNPKFPKQFQKGIKAPPIKMTLKPDAPPLVSERLRRMNETKLAYLKKHIEEFKAQGVIEELKDSTGCHLSPVHIVIEQRYVASEHRNVTKSRMVLDNRKVNECLTDVAFPIPFCDEFRRSVAAEGYTVFSNMDAASFYYQFHVDYETARKWFCFAALGRVYCLRRLCQGARNSPPIAQSFVTAAFREHSNSHPFMDDITVKSKTMDEHLEVDLPTSLAICSKFNILLKPSKCDLLRPEVRILGFQISRSAEALADEKKEKIMSMAFPTTKKEAVSKAAFFAYFLPVAPRLSEYLAPLRKLAQPKTRFKPTEADKDSFQRLKEYLLDPAIGAIRVPSNRQTDTLIVWTDASNSGIGSVVTQMLPPLPGSALDPTKKYLTIVACWSRTLEDAWTSYPIWVLELAALEETTRKFRWLLSGRVFYTMTDSMTVRSWSSIEIVPRDIARKIMRLQRFNYRILFIEGRLNMSDWITRLPTEVEAKSYFPRFLEGRIYNAKGQKMDWKHLFSQRRCDEAVEFFTRNRRQALSSAITPPAPETEEEIDDEHERREALEALQNDQESTEEAVCDEEIDRQPMSGCTDATIAAFGLTDEDVDAGVDEQLEDAPIDEDVTKGLKTAVYEGQQLKNVRDLQEGDETIEYMRQALSEERPAPDKTEVMALTQPQRQFWRHHSLFRLNQQNVVMRLWPKEDGSIDQLIVVGQKQFEALINSIHRSISSPHKHAGQRRTFDAVSKKYFAFGGRLIVKKAVAKCPICKLNSYPRANAEKDGDQIALQPNAAGAVDVIGPIRGFGQTAAGNPRYILLYVDLHSRYVCGKVIQSTADSSIVEAFVTLRDTLCGMPSKMFMDGAIATVNSNALKFLQERGVEVIHGMPNVSRCQSKIERQIGSVMRLVCKLQTADPTLPFARILAEAIYITNSTPSMGLAPSVAPKDVHFARAPLDFLHHASTAESGGSKSMIAARETSRRTMVADVMRHLRKRKMTSPTDYTSKLKVGQLCLRKRTVFPTSSPKKLCYKVLVDGYKIISKVATNHFRVRSVVNGRETTLPGDVLVKVSALNERELVELCNEMERATVQEAVNNSPSAPDGVATRRRTTRARERTREARTAACVVRLDSLFE